MTNNLYDFMPAYLGKFNKLFTLILILGTIFTITNKPILAKVPFFIISALPSGLMLLSLPLLYCIWLIQTYQQTTLPFKGSLINASKRTPISTAVILFYIYALLSTIWYYPSSFIEYRFYRYDANFIISYSPFLLLPFYQHKINTEYLFTLLIIGAAGATFVLLILYFTQGIIGRSQYDQFYPLFRTTNGAGGFYAVICCMALGRLLHLKTWLSLICFVILFFALLLTESRGSILGLLVAIIIFFLIKKPRLRWLAVTGLIIMVVFQGVLIQKFYPVYQSGISGFEYHQQLNQNNTKVKLRNIQRRLIDSWPKAVNLIAQAPILGHGFGSFNDIDKKQLLKLEIAKTEKNRVFNDMHAHHSYLHILAELGIVGLILIGLFWGRLLYELLTPSATTWVRASLALCALTILIASLTEHRITTPAMLLPFSYLFLLYYSDRPSQ